GGMPFLKHLPLQDEIVFDYLEGIYTSILHNDILKRYPVRDVSLLDRLVRFLSDNIAHPFTAKRISDYLKSQRVQLSVNTVMDYVSYLISSQLLLPCRRFDIKGKRWFDFGWKYYIQDLGLRHTLSGFRIGDLGQCIEN